MKIKAVIRDVVILFVLTGLGGFVIGLALGRDGIASKHGLIAMMASNLLFSIVSYTLIGCIARVNRFKHLFIVALVSWVVGAINIVIVPIVMKIPANFGTWMGSLIVGLITMGLGGALSYLFVPAPKLSANESVAQQMPQADGPASGGPAA